MASLLNILLSPREAWRKHKKRLRDKKKRKTITLLFQECEDAGEVFAKYKRLMIAKHQTYFGCARYCNICGYRFANFKIGGTPRREAKCPVCGSFPRHRFLYIFLLPEFFQLKQKRILHFAPEKIIKEMLTSSGAEYYDVDIMPERATYVEDITGLSFADAFFNYVICMHILEHIEDDAKAMAELYRVLQPGGQAFIMVPLSKTGQTLEDKSITSPEERKKLYGQHDHVRIYGKDDLARRLRDAGFVVKLASSSEYASQLVTDELLIRGAVLFIAKKPE